MIDIARRRVVIACALLVLGVCVTIFLLTRPSTGSASGSASGASVDSVINEVLSSVNGNVKSASVSNGTVHVTASDDQITTIWLAELAGTEIAQLLHRQGLLDATVLSVEATSGGPLSPGMGVDNVHQVADAPPLPSGDCQGSVHPSAQLGVRVVSAKTLPVLGGACMLTLQRSTRSTDSAGAVVGQTLSPIEADHTRPYLVTLLATDGSPEQIYGWVPGIGGDYGQGMGWSAPTSPDGSSGSLGPAG